MDPMFPDVICSDRRKGAVSDMQGDGGKAYSFLLNSCEQFIRKVQAGSGRRNCAGLLSIDGLVTVAVIRRGRSSSDIRRQGCLAAICEQRFNITCIVEPDKDLAVLQQFLYFSFKVPVNDDLGPGSGSF